MEHVAYALVWLSFGAAHSLLAGAGIKKTLGSVFGCYLRLAYNVFAAVHVTLVWFVGRGILFEDIQPFALPGSLSGLMTGMLVLGVALIVVALRQYDLGRFSGLTQIRTHELADDSAQAEPLCTGGVHAYVRHPAYSGALLVVWGLAGDEMGIATAVWVSCYLLVGTFLEERRLGVIYGEAYSVYRDKVPAFIPWKGRAT